MSAVLAVVGLFGALFGSFLNVVAYRVPLRQSVVSPPSACPRCGTAIRGYDNIPVISWLLLRGRCRDCAEPISYRYPLVELGTAAFFVAVTGWWLANGGAVGWVTGDIRLLAAHLLELTAFLYLSAVSVALALIDIDTHTLPNRIVLPTCAVGVVLLGGAALLAGDPSILFRAVLGLVALWLGYLALALAYPGGMGLGDVKLAGVLGLFLGYLGWPQLIVGTFAAFVLGGLFAIALLLAGRVTRGGGIPFGPWLLSGAWVGIFVGAPIANGYLSLVGLK